MKPSKTFEKNLVDKVKIHNQKYSSLFKKVDMENEKVDILKWILLAN